VRATCSSEDRDSRPGIGNSVYTGEQSDIAYTDAWCLDDECSFTAYGQLALVDLLTDNGGTQTSFVHTGQIEPREAR